jgi:hypothetical protein
MSEHTVAEVIDAIEKNGFEKITGKYFQYQSLPLPSNNPNPLLVVTGGCALGQASVNLGIAEQDSWEWTYEQPKNAAGEGFAERVFQLNDTTSLSLPEIAAILREEFAENLNSTFTTYEYNYKVSL